MAAANTWRGGSMTSIISPRNRRGDRVADCAGLENRCTARYRGFKSHPLRSYQIRTYVNQT
jgi:hypothetical protein